MHLPPVRYFELFFPHSVLDSVLFHFCWSQGLQTHHNYHSRRLFCFRLKEVGVVVAQDVSVLGGCISVDLHGHLISFSHLG